jgi:hypothetical protein
MSMSPNLVYFVESLQGVSTNTFRLESQNRTSASANDIVTFSLPSNAILNLRSFKVFGNITTANTGAGFVRVPPFADLIERVEVSVGGIVLAQGANFVNVLKEAKSAVQKLDIDSAMGHPEYVRLKSYVDNSVVGALEGYTPTGGQPYFCIDEWEGFLGTADPKLLDTSIIPDIRVRLYMATNNVLSNSLGGVLTNVANAAGYSASTAALAGQAAGINRGAGVATYEVNNLHATIEAIGLADQTYDQLLSSQMASQGYLEIPYKSYQSFNDTHTGASRFSVSTQSLDRVWLAWRDVNYNTPSAPITIRGHKAAGAFVDPTSGAGVTTTEIGLPQYDLGGVLDTNNEKYKGLYFNFVEPQDGARVQLQLNGAYMPQFPAFIGEQYGMTRNSLQGARVAKNMSLDQYRQNYCVSCFRLNLPDSEYSRMICGLDTRSVNLAGVVNTQAGAGGGAINANLMIFTESTETMRVGAGRSIEIIS